MGKPLLSMFIVGCLTFAMYSAAQDAEKGLPEQQFTGRRAGMKTLIYGAGRSLGTTGALALGGVVELACIGWLVMAMQSGKSTGGEDSDDA